MIQTQVLVVGAGPVGLTLALDLAQRGVRVLLVEKNAAPLHLPKMERSNPRTMEIFRRLGVVDRVRAAGLPADMPMDVLIVHSLAEPPLVRQEYPSVAETRRRIAACGDGRLPREPYQLISQYTLEPILLEAARHTPGLTVRQSTEFISLQQDEHGVTAEICSDEGSVQAVRASYVVGCDGGGSAVRKQLGVQLQGRAQIGSITNIFFRCDDFLAKSRVGFARHYCIARASAGGGAAGVIVVQDDMKHLALHMLGPPGFDPVTLLRDVTQLDIHPQILHAAPWTQHLVVAERHAVGRVFLAGDANHLYIPAGGLGMNTGIVDAINLSWKLAGTLQGWGGPDLLASYETERAAVAHRNCDAAAWAIEGVLAWRGAFTPLVLEDSAAGRAARADFVRRAEPMNRRVYEMHGADLGYRYDSAVIMSEEGPAPPSPITAFEPTTWPGAHLPHVWLQPELALYDRLRTNAYTLLHLNGSRQGISTFGDAMRARGAPLDVLSLSDPRIRSVFERDYLLVRPDFHVAWRGNRLPDAKRLAAVVTGYSSP
ncbi:MAG: FAD-dependent oxidoreductase [Steroidobacteraceae bacterium]